VEAVPLGNQQGFYNSSLIEGDTYVVVPGHLSVDISDTALSSILTALAVFASLWLLANMCCGFSAINVLRRMLGLGDPAGRQRELLLRETGVQGPVTYRGRRYVADTQGFRRAWEVEGTFVFTMTRWEPRAHPPATLPFGVDPGPTITPAPSIGFLRGSPTRPITGNRFTTPTASGAPTAAVPSAPAARERADDEYFNGISARFKSRCSYCNREILIGQDIVPYGEEPRTWIHFSCCRTMCQESVSGEGMRNEGD
jgi:hypothetical protein